MHSTVCGIPHCNDSVSFFVHGCPTLTAVSAAAAVLTADKWHRSWFRLHYISNQEVMAVVMATKSNRQRRTGGMSEVEYART